MLDFVHWENFAMGHGAYLDTLAQRKAPCAVCPAVLGIEREASILLVICALAPKMEWANVGRVAIQKALECPGPKKHEDERIAFLNPPDS